MMELQGKWMTNAHFSSFLIVCAVLCAAPFATVHAQGPYPAPFPFGVYLCVYETTNAATDDGTLTQTSYSPANSFCPDPDPANGPYWIPGMQTTASLSGSEEGGGRGYSNSASATVSGTPQLGTISLSSSITSSYAGDGAGGGGGGQIGSLLGWNDTLTVNTANPLGEAVLKVTLAISGKTTPPQSDYSTAAVTIVYTGPAAYAISPTAPNFSPLLPGLVVPPLTQVDGTMTFIGYVPFTNGQPTQVGVVLQSSNVSGAGPQSPVSLSSIAGPDSILGALPNFTVSVNIDPTDTCSTYSTASGTSYYSAPPGPCNTPPTCAQILQNAVRIATGPVANSDGVQYSQSGDPIAITASFTPNYGYTLAQAAAACNVDHFNWQQTITAWPLPLPAVAIGNPEPTIGTLDPPVGGWSYCAQEINGMTNPGYHADQPPCQGAFPYYYSYPDVTQGWTLGYGCTGLSTDTPIETTTTLIFCDKPSASNASAAEPMVFSTKLVGAPGAAGQQLTQYWQMGWESSYNGTVGGLTPVASSVVADPDPGSGTGGVTLLKFGPVNPVPQTTIPNVVGDTQAVATSVITDANLILGTVTQQSSMTVSPGVVLNQSPSTGATAADGSSVNLIVSSGSTCADLQLVKGAFGSKVGQPAYNPVADVNSDRVVNILDLSTVARALPAGTACK